MTTTAVKTWADGSMVAFDLETTGTDPETARIVTASLVEVKPGDKPLVWSAVADPGVEIPEAAARVHGFTTDRARAEGEPASEVLSSLSVMLGDLVESGVPLVIYNAAYDLTALDRECRRHDVETLSQRCNAQRLALSVIDPLVLDRHVDRYRRGKRTLSAVAEHYQVTFTGAHTSEGDCLTAARVAWRIARAYPKVGTLSLPALMALQGAAHADWAEGFEAYRRRNGSDESISRDWPMIPSGVIA